MKFSVVRIRLSELQTKESTVAPWEVPILKVIHGDQVEVVDEVEVDREPPDAEDEYRRLATRYSQAKEESNSVVANVYGTYETGIDALEKEIGKAGKSQASGAKKDRLADLERRQKAESDGLKAKQAQERKDAERDVERREKERKEREKEDEEAERDAAAAERSRAAPAPAPKPTSAVHHGK